MGVDGYGERENSRGRYRDTSRRSGEENSKVSLIEGVR